MRTEMSEANFHRFPFVQSLNSFIWNYGHNNSELSCILTVVFLLIGQKRPFLRYFYEELILVNLSNNNPTK